MFFNDEQLMRLKFSKGIGIFLNEYYENTGSVISLDGKIEKIGISNNFITLLRSLIVSFDDLIEYLANGKQSGAIDKYFNNFINKLKENYENKYRMQDFLWDFYNFIDGIFTLNILFNEIKYNDSIEEINHIKQQSLSLYNSFDGDSDARFKNKFYDRVVLLEENFKRLNEKVNLNSTQVKETVDGFVLAQENDFKKQINDLIEGLRSSLGNIHTTYEQEIKGKVESLGNSVNKTDEDFQSTYDDYQILKKLVQAKGEQQITDHYKKKALWERITYWVMTIGTFGIIIWSICLALNGLDEYKGKTNISIPEMIQQYKDQPVEKIEKIYSVVQNNALTYLVLRLIFSVLLFSSIIYTSRVAYRAYVHMRHSENMMLKLATLRPFINQLEEEDRNQIHKDLVPDYFGKDAGMVDSTNEKFKDLPANVSAVAMKAIEQISGSGSNSSTEKNGKKSEGGTE